MSQHNKTYCKICESSYIETTQKKIEYVCNMCKEYEEKENTNRILPNENSIDWELVMDCGND